MRGDPRSVVGAVVVDQDVLEVVERLAQDTFDSLLEELAGVVERRDNTHRRKGRSHGDIVITRRSAGPTGESRPS